MNVILSLINLDKSNVELSEHEVVLVVVVVSSVE